MRDLDDFARRALQEVRDGEPVPLTPQRALAQARNPWASDTDIGLLLARSRAKCAGYLGILPGRLLMEGALYPVYWFSTWFVPPEFRNAGVALRLLLSAMELNCDLAVTGTSPEADRVYRGLGFREVGPLRFRRFTASLPGPAKRLLYAALLRPRRAVLETIVAREMSRLPEGSEPPPQGDGGPPRFYRGVAVINWMLEHPWIRERRDDPGLPGSYAFSHSRDRFRYVALQIHGSRDGGPRGHLVLSVSTQGPRTTLKVLDFHTTTGDDLQYVLPLALRHASIHEADQVDMPQEVWEAAGPFLWTRMLFRKQDRTYFCRPRDAQSPLAAALRNIRLGYCDGDMAFV